MEAFTEEGFAAALSATVKTGVAVAADPELAGVFGIADHGEDLADFELVSPARST